MSRFVDPNRSSRFVEPVKRVPGPARSPINIAAWLGVGILLLISLALAVRARADELPDKPSWSYTVTPELVSQFMYRGQLLDGFSFQPTVAADYGNYEVGVWSNFPLDSAHRYAQPGDEDDLFGTYTHSFNDNFDLVAGFLLYTYQFSGAGLYRDTFEPSLNLDYTVKGITFTPKVYYDVVLRGPTEELSAAYTYPMPAFHTEADLVGTIGTYLLADAGPSQRAWGNYWLAGVTLPFQLSKKAKLSFGYSYTKGYDAYTRQGDEAKVANPTAVGRGVLDLALAYTF